MSDDRDDEFSVWWWDPLGNYYPEKRFVDAKTAAECFVSMTQRPAAKAGGIARVIITDGGDDTNAEWIYGQGYTYPEGINAPEEP